MGVFHYLQPALCCFIGLCFSKSHVAQAWYVLVSPTSVVSGHAGAAFTRSVMAPFQLCRVLPSPRVCFLIVYSCIFCTPLLAVAIGFALFTITSTATRLGGLGYFVHLTALAYTVACVCPFLALVPSHGLVATIVCPCSASPSGLMVCPSTHSCPPAHLIGNTVLDFCVLDFLYHFSVDWYLSLHFMPPAGRCRDSAGACVV